VDYKKTMIHNTGKSRLPEFNTIFNRKTLGYVINHLREIEFYRELEDELNCSGICKPSLFYYSLELENGPTTQTCLIPLREEIFKYADTFGVGSIIAGINALIMFLLHFCLHQRPYHEESGILDNPSAF